MPPTIGRVGRLRAQVFIQIGKDRPDQMPRQITLMCVSARSNIYDYDLRIVDSRIVDLN